jgi:hypothetical protein
LFVLGTQLPEITPLWPMVKFGRKMGCAVFLVVGA